jgi:hypothetical protein
MEARRGAISIMLLKPGVAETRRGGSHARRKLGATEDEFDRMTEDENDGICGGSQIEPV